MRVSCHCDLESLRMVGSAECLVGAHLKRVLDQKHSLLMVFFAAGFSVLFYGVLPWRGTPGLFQALQHLLPFSLNGLAALALHRRFTDGIQQAIRRPQGWEVKSARLVDAQLRDGGRFETVAGKRHYVPFRTGGSAYVEARMEIDLPDGRVGVWSELIEAWTWNLHYTTDLELMRDQPPSGVPPAPVAFPIPVWVLYQAPAPRGWLVGFPELPPSKWGAESASGS